MAYMIPNLFSTYLTKKRLWLILAFVALAGVAVTFFYGPGIMRVARRTVYRIELAISLPKDVHVKLDVPYHRQEHALSCEVAALTMALQYYDVAITESTLLADLPYDTREPRNRRANTWGDPNRGFVGNIDGTIPNSGYGVYEPPILELAKKYRPARIISGAPLTDLLVEVALGHPVIVWGPIGSGRDISWHTPEGEYVHAVYAEHTRVLMGFTGTADDPQKIILLDPVYGTLVWSREAFLKNWALLDNRAVVIE